MLAMAIALSGVDQQLVDHVDRGEMLDLAGGDGVDESDMRSWGQGRTVRGSVIRDILRGLIAEPDPHGIQLRGARIDDRLDLENLSTEIPIILKDCFLGMR